MRDEINERTLKHSANSSPIALSINLLEEKLRTQTIEHPSPDLCFPQAQRQEEWSGEDLGSCSEAAENHTISLVKWEERMKGQVE